MTTRRDFIKTVTAAGGIASLSTLNSAGLVLAADASGGYSLPKLPYPPEALEPHIDKQTMQIHHGKHHLAYVDGLNKALAGLKTACEKNDFAAIESLSRAVAFHGGGHVNHSIFWTNMAPAGKGGGGQPAGKLAERIKKDFGDFGKFQACFGAAATHIRGSGWAALAWHRQLGRLFIHTIGQHQNNLILGCVPLLMLDLWEHAYYLKYHNRRAAYVKAWWNVVNFKDVEKRFAEATK